MTATKEKAKGKSKTRELPVNEANAGHVETQSPSSSGVAGEPDNPPAEDQKPNKTESFKPPNKTPVDTAEAPPVIKAGSWVRLKAGKGVPDSAVGRDATVVTASVQHSQGDDELSPGGYEYQNLDTVFTVRLRDTGEEFQCTRKSFSSWADNRSGLGGSF